MVLFPRGYQTVLVREYYSYLAKYTKESIYLPYRSCTVESHLGSVTVWNITY